MPTTTAARKKATATAKSQAAGKKGRPAAAGPSEEQKLAKLKAEVKALKVCVAEADVALTVEKAERRRDVRRLQREALVVKKERDAAVALTRAALSEPPPVETHEAHGLQAAEAAAVATVNTFSKFAFPKKWRRVRRFPDCFPLRVEAFARGVREVCGMSLEEFFGDEGNYEVVLHGSRAPWQIMCEGFDPSMRKRQSHGIGEYFTPAWSRAQKYAATFNDRDVVCKATVIAIVIAREARTVSDGRTVVVRNPCDTDLTYCLPVAVATFPGYSRKGIGKCAKCSKTDRGGKVVGRSLLEFVNDSGVWESMGAEVSKHVLSKRSESDYKVTVGKWTYRYDWSSMTQTNVKTGCRRCFRVV